MLPGLGLDTPYRLAGLRNSVCKAARSQRMCDDDIPALLKALRNQSQTFVKEKRVPLMADDANEASDH